MEMILFFITLSCITDIAFDLYVLELNATISLEAITAVLDITVITSFAFAYFSLSEWITRDLFQIGEHFYNSPWYRTGVLSAKQQKLLVLAIQQAQCEVRLQGLGLFDGSLAVFSSVNSIGLI